MSNEKLDRDWVIRTVLAAAEEQKTCEIALREAIWQASAEFGISPIHTAEVPHTHAYRVLRDLARQLVEGPTEEKT